MEQSTKSDCKTVSQSKSDKTKEMKMGECLFKGDIEIKKLKEKAIILMGNTRVGKSTLFNHLLHFPMIGVKGQQRGVINLALTTFNQSGKKYAAQTDPGRKSVTLVPNIESVCIENQEVGLCDTAGFGDEARSYVGTFGVSFMLQKIFQTVKEIKIVLVVNHLIFQQIELARALDPFIKFIKILQASVNNQIAEEFFDFVSIVVTRATYDRKDYIDNIKELIQQNQRQNDIEQRKTVWKLLKNISKNERLEIFKKGEKDVNVQKSQILQNLNKTKWNYFKRQENRIFQLPFKEDLVRMRAEDLDQYQQHIKKKKAFVEKSLQLQKNLLEKARNNWYSKTGIDYHQQFKTLKELIKDHPYGALRQMLTYLDIREYISSGSVLRLQLFDQLKVVDGAINKINKVLGQNTNQCEKQFKNLLDSKQNLYFTVFNQCRKMFCQTQQQQQDYIQFMFINIRSIEEYRMQFIIDKERCSQIPKLLQNIMTTITPASIEVLEGQFLVAFAPQPQQKQDYFKRINEFLTKPSKDKIKSQVLRKIYALSIPQKIKFSIKKIKSGKQKQGLTQLLQTNTCFQSYLALLNQQERTTKQNNFQQLYIFNEIAKCLEKMQLYPLAIQVYEHMKSAHSLVKCYEKMILRTKKIQQKLTIMQDFVPYLQKYGQKERLISLHKQMIDLAIPLPQKREDYMDTLANLFFRDSDTKKYEEQLKSQVDITNNEQLINKIKAKMQESPTIIDTTSQDEDLYEVFHRGWAQKTQESIKTSDNQCQD